MIAPNKTHSGNTEPASGACLDQRIREEIARYRDMTPGELSYRLAELDHEWSIERVLALNLGGAALAGIVLGAISAANGIYCPSWPVASPFNTHSMAGVRPFRFFAASAFVRPPRSIKNGLFWRSCEATLQASWFQAEKMPPWRHVWSASEKPLVMERLAALPRPIVIGKIDPLTGAGMGCP